MHTDLNKEAELTLKPRRGADIQALFVTALASYLITLTANPVFERRHEMLDHTSTILFCPNIMTIK